MTKPKSKNVQLTKGGAPVIAAGAWPEAETPIHNSTSTKPYTAPELRPFAGRPGSLNFLACPSLTGGRRVYRGGAL